MRPPVFRVLPVGKRDERVSERESARARKRERERERERERGERCERDVCERE